MQLDYSQSPAAGYPGMQADTGYKHVISCKNPNVAIPFGLYVTRDDADGRVKLPTTAAEVTNGNGIAIADFASESINNGQAAGYPLKSAVSVMRQGRVWVEVEENVVEGDDVYVRHANGNASKVQKGAFRKSVDQVAAADTATKIPGAKYRTSASAGGIAIVEVNMP